MRFSTFLTAALLPLSVFAIPTTSLETAIEAAVIKAREPVVPVEFGTPTPVHLEANRVVERQSSSSGTSSIASLGDLLGDLLPALKALVSLLNSETINNVKTTVDGLAQVLGNGRAGKTGELLDNVGGLLSQDLINSVKDVLPSVGSLLTKDNVNKIGSLLNNANSLLTENFVKQTVGLINDVAPLVSAISQIITTLIQAVLS